MPAHIGPANPNYTVPDAVVVTIRDLRERRGLSLPEIARETGCAFEFVRSIVYYRRRIYVPQPQQAAGWQTA